MNSTFFFQGLVIGFTIAAPVGPIGILCIQRSLAGGFLSGLVTGLGAATADAVYGCVAGFGLTFIANFILHQAGWLRVAGGFFLGYLGVKTFASKPVDLTVTENRNRLARDYISTFFLTLTNPMTILSFAAIFSGLGLVNASGNYNQAGFLVAGVFAGSAVWWLILSGTAGSFLRTYGIRWMKNVNRLSGAILAGFGVMAILLTIFS